MRRGDGRLAELSGFVAVAVAVLIGLGALAVIAAFTFSVTVKGDSMEPTLKAGDRIDIDLLHRDRVERFDLVTAREPTPPDPVEGPSGGVNGGAVVVKRVIGMPGDRVRITGGLHPEVYLKPAGSETTYLLSSPTWSDQVGNAISSCCTSDGVMTPNGGAGAWATVPAASYWVLGDNWGRSTDSRIFGWVPEKLVQNRLIWRVTPWSRHGRIPNPVTMSPA
ncbi:MAG: signal peptidase I [Nocardioides sp.]|uniref:signal peptidase I n=1 Tax=Nocardioides sp. TaxID=35761 RepID=UPI0039E264A2